MATLLYQTLQCALVYDTKLPYRILVFIEHSI